MFTNTSSWSSSKRNPRVRNDIVSILLEESFRFKQFRFWPEFRVVMNDIVGKSDAGAFFDGHSSYIEHIKS